MNESTQTRQLDHLELAADIVSAYVSNNNVPPADLPAVIANVHSALSSLGAAASTAEVGPEKATPAQIKKSITPNHLISFEDGKPYKTLRRHLTLRNLTAEAYREKWGLPRDYPMTSANYSAQRSQLALALGLGQQRRKAAPRASAVTATVADAPKKQARSGKAAFAAAPKARGRKKSVAAE